METNPTIGEKRIRTDVNPGNNEKVQNLKEKFAYLMNDINDLSSDNSEFGRLKATALTELENAAMWAVKAATA